MRAKRPAVDDTAMAILASDDRWLLDVVDNSVDCGAGEDVAAVASAADVSVTRLMGSIEVV